MTIRKVTSSDVQIASQSHESKKLNLVTPEKSKDFSYVIKRGDMFYADLSPVIGSEQGGIRPVVIIQNDLGNKYSPTVIAAAITSQTGKNKLPTHIEIGAEAEGLKSNSVILAEQIRTIDKSRLRERIGHIDDAVVMNKINNALGVSFGLDE